MSAETSPLFLVPLRTEALAVRRGARAATRERIGMGPVRASAARARLARVAAGQPIVLLGFAGALDPALRAGDLVVASASRAQEDAEALLLPEGAAVARLLTLAGMPGSVHLGTLLSTPRVLRGRSARAEAAATGALAVDMESRWCAPLSQTHPFAVVRAVVDVPGHEIVSVATPAATWKAFRALAAAAGALRGWSPVSLKETCKVGDR